MKIACIDDVPDEGNRILNLVKNKFSKYKIDIKRADYYSGTEAFFLSWHPGMYNLIFIDIMLYRDSGIEIAKAIRKLDFSVPVVFCSSSNEYASESYEVGANYYLVKPVSDEKLERMIHKLNLLRSQDEMLELPDGKMILLSQFVYSEYNNHSITIFMKNGRQEKIWSSQNELLKVLEPFGYFISVTPGTVVNLKEVKEFRDYSFIMKNGSVVPISKRKKKEILMMYKNYLFSELRRN